MCLDPATAATLAMTVSAISTGVSAFGAYRQQQASNAAAEYNATVSQNNARIAEMQAENATHRGGIEERQHRLRVSQLEGEQRAGFAAAGVQVDTGSPFSVIDDTVEFGELDALTIRHNAAMEAWGLRNQASNSRAQARLSLSQRSSPGFAAGTTLLSGAGRLAGQYSGYKDRGIL